MAKNTLRAVFTLVLPSGLIISGCMLHEKNGKRWVSLPAREYQDQRGARQFAPFLSFVDRGTSDRFQSQALEAIDAALAETSAA